VIKKKVGIINYKAGNIYSVKNSFNYLGCETYLLNNIKDFKNIDYIVLPGVGSYGYCVNSLSECNYFSDINKLLVKNRVPCLCICVGMQMLGLDSEESLKTPGLELLDFNVTRIKKKKNFKLPHVGWDDVVFNKNFGFFKKNQKYDFYFDHSYIVDINKYTLGVTNYGERFSAVLQHKNILACQFHPEKSQENGLNFLKSFISFYA
jgi:glutamine amidotransferase